MALPLFHELIDHEPIDAEPVIVEPVTVEPLELDLLYGESLSGELLGNEASPSPPADWVAYGPEHYLVASTQPSVVFTSLTRLSVPVISDACTVQITEDVDICYAIRYPKLSVGPSRTAPSVGTITRRCAAPAEYAVRTWFDVPFLGGHLSYRGHVTHTWTGYRPTPRDKARATQFVAHAVHIIGRDRRAVNADTDADQFTEPAQHTVTTAGSHREHSVSGLARARRTARRS